MLNALFRGLAVIAVLCLCGCSGAASNQPSSDDPNPPISKDSALSPTDDTGDSESSIDSQTATNQDTGVPQSDTCGGKTCEDGKSCIEYYGIAGNLLYTCGIPCKENEPNNGCPEEMQCQVIPDGPTQCMKRKP